MRPPWREASALHENLERARAGAVPQGEELIRAGHREHAEGAPLLDFREVGGERGRGEEEQEGLEVARHAVRPRGTIVLKSTYHGRAEIDMSPLVVDEITLVGSRCGPFAPALSALAGGSVDPRPLIEARYPLSEAVAAFEHAARPGALKVLVEC